VSELPGKDILNVGVQCIDSFSITCRGLCLNCLKKIKTFQRFKRRHFRYEHASSSKCVRSSSDTDHDSLLKNITYTLDPQVFTQIFTKSKTIIASSLHTTKRKQIHSEGKQQRRSNNAWLVSRWHALTGKSINYSPKHCIFFTVTWERLPHEQISLDYRIVNKIYKFTYSKTRHVDCLTLNTGVSRNRQLLISLLISLDNTTMSKESLPDLFCL
jgi:hypothetical protein